MWLKNFNVMMCWNSGSASSTSMSGTTGQVVAQSTSFSYGNATCHYSGNGSGAFWVAIGAGDTAPTSDDYDMADSSIMASDKMVSQKQFCSASRDGGAICNTQWVNNSSSPITVKEIGIAYKTGSATYNKGVNYLMGRKVLDTPVTIQPGEVYVFTYRISIV